MTPKISVIIPVYNMHDELEACLASLKKQTIQDFEIIVIDDASDIPVKDASVRFDKNHGAPAARNEGFRRSKGAFIIFLDADAVLRPDALEKMHAALEAHPDAAFAYPSFRFGWKTFRGRPFDQEALKRGNYIHTSALIRRDAFPGFDESLKKFQDWDLFLTMAEQGKRGVFIDEVLFALKANGTMSQWLPSFVYQISWPVFGWMPIAIKKYRIAEKIIHDKHKTGPAASPPSENFFEIVQRVPVSASPVLCFIFVLELLSIPAAFDPMMNSIFAILVGIFVLVASFVSPVHGMALLALELLIGSKGRMLVFGPDLANDGGIALRIILFVAFFVGWVGSLVRERRFPVVGSWIKDRLPWLAFALVLITGFLQGWREGNSFLLVDANAWGWLLMLLPALDLATQNGKELWMFLRKITGVGLAWISMKTLMLFYFFSHDFGSWLEPVYLWIRRTGVGEVTLITKTASAYRVFIQSQIYQTLAAVAIMSGISRSTRQQLRSFGGQAQHAARIMSNDSVKALAILLAVAVVSFSRSFWIGIVAGCFLIAIDVFRRKTWLIIPRFALSGVGALVIVFVLFAFPFPKSYGNFTELFFARAEVGESAAQSRWELLPVLNQKIVEAPFFGHGFGATVTYQSKDPRVIAKTGGTYTTYAFEWGWHDLAVKLGLVGVLVYLWLLLSLAYRLGPANRPWQIVLAVLSVVHVFTPYLNHPLGLMVIVLTEARILSTAKNGSRKMSAL